MIYLENIPNFLTTLRVCLIPFFLYFLFFKDVESKVIALIIFIIASLTDLLDGYLARKWKVTSKLGTFLDPLADKALIISALVAFILLDNQIPIWMLIVIVSRDILITLMRILGKRKGMEVKTSTLGKVKTVVQMTTIILILLIFVGRSYKTEISLLYQKGNLEGKTNIQIALGSLLEGFDIWWKKEIDIDYKKKVFAYSMPYFLLLFTTILTIISGISYIFKNKRIIQAYLPKNILKKEKL